MHLLGLVFALKNVQMQVGFDLRANVCNIVVPWNTFTVF
jgi:hypothetical protein